MTGKQLFNEVFSEEEVYELQDIQELDNVTCYNEELSYEEDWFNYYEVTFRYEGKKYSFEKREHSSPNVSQTDYNMDSFSEVVSGTNLHKKIDNIIKYIEEDKYHTWEDVIADLEEIKSKFE